MDRPTDVKSKIKKKVKKNDDPKAIYEKSVVPFLMAETSFVGFHIFDPDYKINFRFGLTIFDAPSYIILNAIDLWLIWGSDFEIVCFCLVTWMFGFTGMMLCYTVMDNKMLYCDLLKIIYDFGDNLKKASEKEEIEKYKKNSLVCWQLVRLTTFCCTAGGIVISFYPIVVYYLTGKAILPFGYFIPGIDTKTITGYLFTYTYQVCQCVITVVGVLQSTFHSYILFASNAFFQIENLIIKLRKLNDAIEANPNKAGHETKLKDIIDLHQRFQSYLQMVDDAHSSMFFVNLACYTFMNIVTLFALVRQPWFPGYYIIILVIFGLIFLPCAIGTYVEMKNDEFINEIYCISWYLLIPKERKPFKLFLLGVQATPMLTCRFLPLNVNTFRLTYSKIYSILMFLLDTQG